MGDDRSQRIDAALSTLVDLLVPLSPEDDFDTAADGNETALSLAREILERL